MPNVRLFSDDGSSLRVPTTEESSITDNTFTLAALIVPGDKVGFQAIVSAWDPVNEHSTWSFGISSSNKPYYQVTNAAGSTQTVVSEGDALTVGDPYIVVYTSQPAREFSVYDITAEIWSHDLGNLVGGINDPVASSYLSFGRDTTFDIYLDAQLALYEQWNVGLNQAQREALATNLESGDWTNHAVAPVGFWSFTQDAETEDVADVTGNHVTITGTITSDSDTNGIDGGDVVDAADFLTWDFTVPPPLMLFELRLSGGASNDNKAMSIGGPMSSVLAQDFFDDVSSTQAQLGLTDYRLIYVVNLEEAADGLLSGYIALQQAAPVGHSIAFGPAVEDAGEEVDPIASDTTAPSGVTFYSTEDEEAPQALGDVPANSYRGVWFRRIVPADTPDSASNPAQVILIVEPDVP